MHIIITKYCINLYYNLFSDNFFRDLHKNICIIESNSQVHNKQLTKEN